MKASEKIILALDVDDRGSALGIAERFRDHIDIFKIGSELFTAVGPVIIKDLHELGKKVFLDLKFHDIPNTAAKSVRAAAEHGIFMLNVHASGGLEMMKRAAQTLSRVSEEKGIERPKLIAVTLLTSIDQTVMQNEIGIEKVIKTQVTHLVKLAKSAGLDGVVASPQETEMIRSACGEDFLIVTPGIRPSWADLDDQKRTMTPAEALRKGADYLVIGRAILSQSDPVEALMRTEEEIVDAI
jgi:orotidine-5'-phosphate decarboxylase